MYSEWFDQIVDPVRIVYSRDQAPPDECQHPNISCVIEEELPSVAWPWFPRQVPRWGLGSTEDPIIRQWFIGRPQGQEVACWQEALLAISRHRSSLSPLTTALLAQFTQPISIAVLLTPA